MSLKVGTLVRLKIPCLGNDARTLGYVFHEYDGGCQVIFKNGEYDGFGDRPESQEVQEFLDVVGETTHEYIFTNVIKLNQDFRAGYFKEIFQSE